MLKRIMFYLAWSAIVVFSAYAYSQTPARIFLECTGRFYEYETWQKLLPSSKNDSLIVTLDTATKIMNVSFWNTGALSEPYSESDTFYDMTKEYAGKTLLGKRLDKLEFWINRMTGQAMASYSFANEKSEKLAFLGGCAPAKKKF